MTTLLLALLALVAVSSIVTFLAVRHAPEGYEDETGFHAVRPARISEASPRSANTPHLHGDHFAGGLA